MLIMKIIDNHDDDDDVAAFNSYLTRIIKYKYVNHIISLAIFSTKEHLNSLRIQCGYFMLKGYLSHRSFP